MTKNLSKLICIAGLPASGKSTFALEFSQKHQNCLIIDDEILMHNTNQYFFENSQEIKKYDFILIVDVNFCRKEVQDKANLVLEKALGITPEWIYFANEPEKALLNASKRSNKPVDNLIKYYAKIYNPPPEALPVFDSSVNQRSLGTKIGHF